MKLLIRYESCASDYIYRGLGKAFEKLGHERQFWYADRNSAFDVFNNYEPDIFLGQGYNLDRAQIKCINQRPHLKCLLKVGISGELDGYFEHDKYEALFSSPQEKLNVDAIQNKDRLFLFNYGFERYHDLLLYNWKSVANTFMLPLAADTNAFYSDYNKHVKCDISFSGGYWSYKARNLDKYILPLCYPVGNYNIRLFGNQAWPAPQYLGFVDDDLIRQVISSSRIVPACHEPHANKYGYEAESRIFNIPACKTLTISDYVETYKLDVFTDDELPMFDNPKDYHECIDYYLKKNEEREKLAEKQYEIIMSGHTYDHRIADILRMLK